MAVDRPVGINDPTGAYTYDAATFRRFLSASLVHDADPLAARPGVLHGLGATVSGTTVTMATGSAVVTPLVTAHGSYEVSASSPTALPALVRDGTYTRRDLISLQVLDPEVSGATRVGQFVVTTGVPAPSPVTPTGPAGSLPLWVASVPPGAAAVALIDVRQWTAAVGGTIPCTSTTRPSGANLRPGQSIFETDTNLSWMWSGTTWVFNAGQRDHFILKPSNSAYFAALGVYSLDPHLQIAVPAGNYFFDGQLVTQSNGPTNALYRWTGVTWYGSTATMQGAEPVWGASGYVSTIVMTVNQNYPARISGQVTTSGGTIGLEFARSNTDRQIQVVQGSWLRLTRLV